MPPPYRTPALFDALLRPAIDNAAVGSIQFVLADSQHSGGCEALLSFGGEPFMAQAAGRDVPRFVFHVHQHSELLPHVLELEGCSAHFRSRTQ